MRYRNHEEFPPVCYIRISLNYAHHIIFVQLITFTGIKGSFCSKDRFKCNRSNNVSIYTVYFSISIAPTLCFINIYMHKYEIQDFLIYVLCYLPEHQVLLRRRENRFLCLSVSRSCSIKHLVKFPSARHVYVAHRKIFGIICSCTRTLKINPLCCCL